MAQRRLPSGLLKVKYKIFRLQSFLVGQDALLGPSSRASSGKGHSYPVTPS